MAKKDKTAPAVDVVKEDAVTPETAATEVKEVPRSRGPRGTEESNKISLIAKENPKRPGSKAFAVFSNYVDGMTIKEFADAVGKEATPNLVYDAKHGFISIEGYDPGAIITPKPKAEKAPKEPKPKKPRKVKEVADPDAEDKAAAVEAEVVAETID